MTPATPERTLAGFLTSAGPSILRGGQGVGVGLCEGARPFVLRLLAAALGGAALCIAAEEAGLLPEAQAQGGEKGDETSDQ